MGGVSNAVGQSSNQPNQQPQYGQQGLAGMAQGVGNAIGGMMQSPFMGQVGQAISGQQPAQSGLVNFPYESGTPSYGQLVPQQSQGIANVNPGIRPTPEQDALVRQQMAQMGMSPNQPLNPYMSGTPSYSIGGQTYPQFNEIGMVAPGSLAGTPQAFQNPQGITSLAQLQAMMGNQPAPAQALPQQSVQAPHMTAYDRLVQQRNQNLAGPTSNPFGFPQRNNFQQQMAPKAPTLNAQQMTNGPQRGFPQQSMLAQALRKGV